MRGRRHGDASTRAKLGHWVAPGKAHTGELEVAPIGIPDGAPVEAAAGLIDAPVLALAPPRGAGSTKFSSGQVVVVGGSRGLTGAVCMSASAAIRSGAGYATVAVPAELEQIFEVKLTEVMSVGCPSREGRLRRAASEQVLGACERRRRRGAGPRHRPRGRDQGPRAQPGHADRGAAGDRRGRAERSRGAPRARCASARARRS